MNNKFELEDICFFKANMMMSNGLSQDMDLFELTDLLISVEKEKLEKQQLEDENINFNDEIVSIEDMGELDTIDISVTGDQLFYCNDILTKNSMGLVMTADAVFALITTEELEAMGQLMIKQLKNRWGDLSHYRRFVIGIDRAKMKLFNLEQSAQDNMLQERQTKKTDNEKSTFDKTDFAEQWGNETTKNKKKKLFETNDIT